MNCFQGEGYANPEHPQAIYELGPQNGKKVWINWRDETSPNKYPTPEIKTQVEELAILLKALKPDEFCMPKCHPAGIAPEVQPLSLLNAFERYPKPSLTDRFALAHRLAQALLYLHAVNWLHKAFCSSNILLFPTNDSEINIRSPYITGFDNSRRSRFDESTTQVPREGRMEVFRHPDTQQDGALLSYRKTFYTYSLGLVLAEIAFWKPMVTIMGIENTVDRYTSSTSDIQESWLTSEPALLAKLREKVGNKFASAVEVCLKGRDAYGITALDNETSESTALTIHRNFNAMVVRAIAEIVT